MDSTVVLSSQLQATRSKLVIAAMKFSSRSVDVHFIFDYSSSHLIIVSVSFSLYICNFECTTSYNMTTLFVDHMWTIHQPSPSRINDDVDYAVWSLTIQFMLALEMCKHHTQPLTIVSYGKYITNNLHILLSESP